MATKVTGVTPENWPALAHGFMIASGGKGFVIVRDHWKASRDFPVTLRQWGAWRAYWSSKRIPFMGVDGIGRATVPAEWPHQFDADWGVGNDDQAGDMFESSWRRRHPPKTDAEKAKVAAAQPSLLAESEGL